MVNFFSILTRYTLRNQTLFIQSLCIAPGMVVTVKAWQQLIRFKIIDLVSERI